MPRIRSIKPEFWQDSRLSRLPALTRLVYVCLWSMADDEGRIEGDAETVRSFGFPRESIEDVSRALATLREHSRALAYVSEGVPHIVLPKFTKHQKIDHPSQSKLPAPPTLTTDSPNPREPSRIVAPDQGSGIRDQGEDQGAGIKDHGTMFAGEAPAQAVRKIGPQDQAARNLAKATGSSLAPCRKQVAALMGAGWAIDRIEAAIVQHASPGLAPWDWTKIAQTGGAVPSKYPDHGPRSPSSNGATLARLASEKAKAQADLEAFKASGCATRSEWVARKAQA